ncbi:UNVERIFIED_CONTAM: hypothetical protein GTU68_003243 [Idotea baltica]|nr:hypothetical protein [Idotea baltica]
MLIVLSPAKTLDFESPSKSDKFSEPEFVSQTEVIAKKMRTVSRKKLAELMKISANLAALNYDRFQNFEPGYVKHGTRTAIHAFKGDVYLGLEAEKFTTKQLDFAQNHLRILSGMYGLLRPMDLIQPYRLEMGTKIGIQRKKNLYEFWGNQISESINTQLSQLKQDILVNLASNEYFKAVDKKSLNANVITPAYF